VVVGDRRKPDPEEVDEDYPAILEDLKFYVAKQKIVDENDIKVEIADVEAMAVEVARAQFAQYGMTNLPADVLQNYAQGLLEKEETVRSLYEQATESKLIEWLMEHVTVIEKSVTTKEFGEIVEEHTRLHTRRNRMKSRPNKKVLLFCRSTFDPYFC